MTSIPLDLNDPLPSRAADTALVATLDRPDQPTVRLLVLPGRDGAELLTTDLVAAAAMSTLADSFADATWEDAEWQ
jgi:hypothetical protein